MALPQRDKYIDEIMKTDALLEYAVMHGMDAEAERLRAKLRRLADMGDDEGEGPAPLKTCARGRGIVLQ